MDKFTSKEIIKRIEKTIQFGIDFLSLQNNKNFLRDIKENFDFDNFSGNIEELLFECFKLVINKRNQYFKVLNEKCFLELLTLLKRIFINAIFVKNNQLINIEIPDVIVGKIKSYKRIFSTNYYEYWDNKNITTHLHGKISFTPFDKSEYSVDEEGIIYDIEYASAIDDLFIEKYHFPIENLEDMIMLPSGYKIDKNEKPKVVVLENVRSLRTHDKGRTFKTILNILEKDLGYKPRGGYLARAVPERHHLRR